jgi:tRNA threonylcarbamoyladenosine biosynthesis protein TsaE
MNRVELATGDAAATRALGAWIARRLPPGSVLLLQGPLGAGKTTLVQGLAAGLGIRDRVSSPTFALVREYTGQGDAAPALVHVDLYRLERAEEVRDLGLEEVFDDGAVVAVEWPERAGGRLPAGAIRIEIAPADGGRRIGVGGCGAGARQLVAALGHGALPAGVRRLGTGA